MNVFEVEIKFRVRSVTELESHLKRRFGATQFSEQVTESDSFFQHPCRNFVETDECLRLRQRSFQDGSSRYSLTYKGPKIDTTTKTRREIESSLSQPEQIENIFSALGFFKAASVQKFRRRMQLTVEGRQIDVVLDTLPDLPESNRCFVELETMADENEVDECRLLIITIAEQLGLNEPIRDSYLKLVQTYQKGKAAPSSLLPLGEG